MKSMIVDIAPSRTRKVVGFMARSNRIGFRKRICKLCLVFTAFQDVTTVRSFSSLASKIHYAAKHIHTTVDSLHISRSTQRLVAEQSALILSVCISDVVEANSDAPTDPNVVSTALNKSPLSLYFDELSILMKGKGRAKMVWDFLRQGIDPSDALSDQRQDGTEEDDGNISLSYVSSHNTTTSFVFDVMGHKAKSLYLDAFRGKIEDNLASVSNIQLAKDGTTKLLLQLHQDGLEVETVIIPWPERESSTLCISSQVGCRQGCTFCMTGRMGKLRSLTADEILVQVYFAVALARKKQEQKHQHQRANKLFPIDNVVFMGMGEPADNADVVVRVANILVNPNQFRLAPRKVTISTVAPHPTAFKLLGQAQVALAWSLHASRDELRKQLVPSTKYSMIELRDGLVRTLQERSRRMQSILLEMTLLDNINDSRIDALHLVDFVGPIFERVPHVKLVVNLIPWNKISATSGPAANYCPPTQERLLAFQKTLVDRGLRCYIRTVRGDDESAACGQLATRKKRTTILNVVPRKSDLNDTTMILQQNCGV